MTKPSSKRTLKPSSKRTPSKKAPKKVAPQGVTFEEVMDLCERHNDEAKEYGNKVGEPYLYNEFLNAHATIAELMANLDEEGQTLFERQFQESMEQVRKAGELGGQWAEEEQ